MTAVAKNELNQLDLDAAIANGFFDEMFGRESSALSHYQKLRGVFNQFTHDDFKTKRNSVDLAFLRQGVTFNVDRKSVV